MRFMVPQFVDVEDKILGPLTLKQGIYILGGVGITVGIYIKFGFFWAVVVGAPILLLAFLLAFVKVQGRPFVYTMSSALFYFSKNKLYLWKKMPKKKDFKVEEKEEPNNPQPTDMRITQSRLKNLAIQLDTRDNFEEEK